MKHTFAICLASLLTVAPLFISCATAQVQAPTAQVPQEPPILPFREIKHKTWVDALTLSPDGKLLASTTTARQDDKPTVIINLWDVETGQLVTSWDVGPSGAETLTFSPDGKLLVAGVPVPGERKPPGEIFIWNLQGQKQKTLTGHTREVSALAFSPDGKTLASGSISAKELILWDLKSGQKQVVSLEGLGKPTALAFSPDGTRLAIPGDGFDAGVWDVKTLKQVATMNLTNTMRGAIYTFAFSPDGKTLATGDTGHGLRLWDAQSGKLQATLLHIKDNWTGAGPSGNVNGLLFTPDGKTLISAGINQEGAGGESELLLWGLPDNQIKRSLIPSPNNGINRFAASKDGRVLATTESLSGTVKLWRLP